MKRPVILAYLLALAGLVGPPGVFAQNIAHTDVTDYRSPSSILELPAHLTLHEVALPVALTLLNEKSGVRVAFSPSLLPTSPPVSCECTDVTVREALDQILAKTGFRYSTLGDQILIEPKDLPVDAARVILASNQAAARAVRLPAGLREPSTVERPRVQQGTITGRVVAARDGRPLGGVQVFVEGTNLGALTDAQGQFRIGNVPAGEVTVRFQSIGFARGERTVSVAEGQTIALDIELREEAVGLDEIVVTGTAGTTPRRAVGTSISSIDVDRTLEAAPITSFSQMVSGRVAGVVGMQAVGQSGAAGSLVLRGATSLAGNNQPIIYLDGVRLESGIGVDRDGYATDRLKDINLQDIARVEIIRGAAATTLYGSEASSGVIQLFSKQGFDGPPVVSANVQVGANWIPSVFPLPHPDPQYPSANDILRTGLHQNYNISVRGGSGPVNYFTSGSFLESEGGMPGNRLGRLGGRMNLGFTPSDRLSLTLNVGVTATEQEADIADNVVQGVVGTILLGDPVRSGTEDDPFGGSGLPVWYAMSQFNIEEVFRVVGGATLQHQLTDNIAQRLTVGLDRSDIASIESYPYHPTITFPGSFRELYLIEDVRNNIDYGLSWTTAITPALGSQFSIGGQLTSRNYWYRFAEGRNFPAGGLEVVGAATNKDAAEEILTYTTGGLYVQQQLDFNDRLYFTAGVRVDGSSAFGDDFGFQPYPKASVSYVISDEPWFNLPLVSSLRLRSGWGQAGSQPGAFDAMRTYEPFVAIGGQPAFRPANLGNPDLAPEVTTEIEAGFDLGLAGDRVSLEFTAYNQNTNDALINREFPASLGFLQSQLTNVGSLRNRGFEVGINGTLLERGAAAWTGSFTYSYNDSEVIDTDGATFFVDRFGTRVIEGYPLPSKWETVQVGTDEEGFPIPSDDPVYLGPAFAPHNGSIRTDVTLGNVRAFANGQFAAGQIISYLGRPYRLQRGLGEEYWNAVIAAGGDEDAREVRILRAEASCCAGDFYERGDFLKLREVGISYNLQRQIFGAQPRIYVSGANLLTLTNYSGTDPEISAQLGSDGQRNLSVGSEFSSIPQQRHIMFGIDVEF